MQVVVLMVNCIAFLPAYDIDIGCEEWSDHDLSLNIQPTESWQTELENMCAMGYPYKKIFSEMY